MSTADEVLERVRIVSGRVIRQPRALSIGWLVVVLLVVAQPNGPPRSLEVAGGVQQRPKTPWAVCTCNSPANCQLD